MPDAKLMLVAFEGVLRRDGPAAEGSRSRRTAAWNVGQLRRFLKLYGTADASPKERTEMKAARSG